MKFRLLAVVPFGILFPVVAWAQAPAAKTPPTPPATPPPAAVAVLAFPGQWAPPTGDRLHPGYPKPCRALADATERLTCFEHAAYHWPGLDRYSDANAALAPAARGEQRVVFMGDSITDNWSKPGYGGFFPGRPYVNRGIGGQSTGQMLVRFRADVVALRPKVVVILAGTNDVAGNAGPLRPGAVENNLSSMAEIARQNGIKVVLATMLPVSDEGKTPDGKPRKRTDDRPPATLQQLNAWIADYAKKNRHTLLDYHAAVADAQGVLRPEFHNDGLHPTAAGYAVMAPLAEKAIKAALRGR